MILMTPVWPTQPWYPRLLDLSISHPVLMPLPPDLLQGPHGERHPLVENQTLSLAAWHVQTLPSSYWQLGGQAQMQFITPPARNAIAGVSHCRQIDPLCPSVANITRFLAWSFNQGLQRRTITTYRSALSGILPPIEGFAVGQHPLIIRLLKGVLNLRPATPRYQPSWDSFIP